MGNYVRRNSNENCYYIQKEYFAQFHKMFNNDLLNTTTTIQFIDSHKAHPYYNKDTNSIVLDTHFLDILRIVTAIMISNDGIEYMDELAYACSADYFLCKDEVYLALKYAEMFSKNKSHIEQLIKDNVEDMKALFYIQLMFVLSHEQTHALLFLNSKDSRFDAYRASFYKEQKLLMSIAKEISSIDISPIKKYLDQLDKSFIESDYDYSLDSYKKMLKYILEMKRIVDLGVKIIKTPKNETISKHEMVWYACDMYLKKSEIKLLEHNQYEEDCLCDGYSLSRILGCKLTDDVVTHIKNCIFAYYSCLLTMNIITCVDACVMNYRMEGYNGEDLVWNRLRLERDIFNNVISQYAYSKPRGCYMFNEVFSYAASLVEKYNKLYARFCNELFSVEQPTEQTQYCPCGCDEYDKLYDKVRLELETNLYLNLETH